MSSHNQLIVYDEDHYFLQLVCRVLLRLAVFFAVVTNSFHPISANGAKLPPTSSSSNALVNLSILKRLIYLKQMNGIEDRIPSSSHEDSDTEASVLESATVALESTETSVLLSLMTEVVRSAQSNEADTAKARSLFSEALPRLWSFLHANNDTQKGSTSHLMKEVSPVLMYLVGAAKSSKDFSLGSRISSFSNRTARGWGGCECGKLDLTG